MSSLRSAGFSNSFRTSRECWKSDWVETGASALQPNIYNPETVPVALCLDLAMWSTFPLSSSQELFQSAHGFDADHMCAWERKSTLTFNRRLYIINLVFYICHSYRVWDGIHLVDSRRHALLCIENDCDFSVDRWSQ